MAEPMGSFEARKGHFPSGFSMDRLNERAARWGIEPGYFDVQGRRQEADAETLRRIVEALSAGGKSPAVALGQRRIRSLRIKATAARPGCWRSSFTACGRGAIGATAISPISRRCWRSLPIWAARGVGLNPLHAQFYDRPGSGSPYSPNSRLFLNPLYIDVEAVEEFSPDLTHASLRSEIDRLRAAELVDYPPSQR